MKVQKAYNNLTNENEQAKFDKLCRDRKEQEKMKSSSDCEVSKKEKQFWNKNTNIWTSTKREVWATNVCHKFVHKKLREEIINISTKKGLNIYI